MLAPVSAPMLALAAAAHDPNAHRADEPYRRALIGMYARLAATLQALTGTEALRHALAPQQPYADAAELLADLRTIEASLRSHHARSLIGPTTLAPMQCGRYFFSAKDATGTNAARHTKNS